MKRTDDEAQRVTGVVGKTIEDLRDASWWPMKSLVATVPVDIDSYEATRGYRRAPVPQPPRPGPAGPVKVSGSRLEVEHVELQIVRHELELDPDAVNYILKECGKDLVADDSREQLRGLRSLAEQACQRQALDVLGALLPFHGDDTPFSIPRLVATVAGLDGDSICLLITLTELPADVKKEIEGDSTLAAHVRLLTLAPLALTPHAKGGLHAVLAIVPRSLGRPAERYLAYDLKTETTAHDDGSLTVSVEERRGFVRGAGVELLHFTGTEHATSLFAILFGL